MVKSLSVDLRARVVAIVGEGLSCLKQRGVSMFRLPVLFAGYLHGVPQEALSQSRWAVIVDPIILSNMQGLFLVL